MGVSRWRDDTGDLGDGFTAGLDVAHRGAGVLVAGLGHELQPPAALALTMRVWGRMHELI